MKKKVLVLSSLLLSFSLLGVEEATVGISRGESSIFVPQEFPVEKIEQFVKEEKQLQKESLPPEQEEKLSAEVSLQELSQAEIVNVKTLYNSFQLQGKMDYKVFERAYLGYLMIREKDPDYFAIVDYTKPSNEKRFFLLDMKQKKVVNYTYVSHAKNTGLEMAYHFSNRRNSLQNSLGFYRTKGTYDGQFGYSLKLEGLEEEFNSNAEDRTIVLHGGDFAEKKYLETYGFLGRSWGCPVIPLSEHKAIIDKIKHGHILFIAGNNEEYETNSKFQIKK